MKPKHPFLLEPKIYKWGGQENMCRLCGGEWQRSTARWSTRFYGRKSDFFVAICNRCDDQQTHIFQTDYSPSEIAASLVTLYSELDSLFSSAEMQELASRWQRVYCLKSVLSGKSGLEFKYLYVSDEATLADMLEVLRSTDFRNWYDEARNHDVMQDISRMLYGSQWDTIDEFIAQEVKP